MHSKNSNINTNNSTVVSSNTNTNTNYSETDSNFSSDSSNSNTEVVFGRTVEVRKKPQERRVRFATRRKVRKTNKTPEAVESRKGYKKKKKGPYVTKNMNAKNRRILRNATKRLKYSKEEKQQRAWAYLDFLKMLKEDDGEDFLTTEQRNFIDTEILGHLQRNSNSNTSSSNNNSNT